MALSKAAGGYLLNSQTLLADAFHSFTDLVSDFLTLGTVAWSLKPPTTRFPSGYGKIESLGSLGVSSLLLAGGIGLGWHSCELLYNMWFVVDAAGALGDLADHGHEHSHGHGHGGGILGHSHSHNPADMGIPNVHAAWIAGGSILVKEYLYRASEFISQLGVLLVLIKVLAIKIARERKSSVLASNAIHHRIDSLTSIVALTAILGSNIFSNISWLDPVGGLLVSTMVIRAGWTNTGNSLLELADVGIDSEVKEMVRNAAVETFMTQPSAPSGFSSKSFKVSEVQGIKAGQSYLVEVEVGVPSEMPIKKTQPIEHAIRANIGNKVRGIRRVRVKFVPDDDQGSNFADEFIETGNNRKRRPVSNGADNESHDTSHRLANGYVTKRR